eukprot:scaffold527_cov368-Prasinococcus_capsulatus_cf.AAC.45
MWEGRAGWAGPLVLPEAREGPGSIGRRPEGRVMSPAARPSPSRDAGAGVSHRAAITPRGAARAISRREIRTQSRPRNGGATVAAAAAGAGGVFESRARGPVRGFVRLLRGPSPARGRAPREWGSLFARLAVAFAPAPATRLPRWPPRGIISLPLSEKVRAPRTAKTRQPRRGRQRTEAVPPGGHGCARPASARCDRCGACVGSTS